MDKKNRISMASDKLQSRIVGQKVAVGAKQIRKALISGSAASVFLACNADPAITEPLEELCKRNNVTYAWVKSMTDLGHACGIEVGAAAAATLTR